MAVTCETSGSVATAKQIVMAAQPPQQPIQNGETFDVAMQDRGLRQFDEFGRDAEGGVWHVGQRRCDGGRE